MGSQQILTKLERLEQEILKMKKGTIIRTSKKLVSLKGILKGVKVNDKDIQRAKKSLFKEIKI
jgi:hypothetical protein